MQTILYLYFSICTKRDLEDVDEVNCKYRKSDFEISIISENIKHSNAHDLVPNNIAEDEVSTNNNRLILNSKPGDEVNYNKLQFDIPVKNQSRSQDDLFNNFIIDSCDHFLKDFQKSGLPIVNNWVRKSKKFPNKHALNLNPKTQKKNSENMFLIFYIKQNNESLKNRIEFNEFKQELWLNQICADTNINFEVVIDRKVPNTKNLFAKIILAILCENNPQINNKKLKVKNKYEEIVKSNPNFLIFLHYISSQNLSGHNDIDTIDIVITQRIIDNLQTIMNYVHANYTWPENDYQEFVKNILDHILDQKTIAENYRALQDLQIKNKTLGLKQEEKKTLYQFIFFFINYKENDEFITTLNFNVKQILLKSFSRIHVIVKFITRFKKFINSLDMDLGITKTLLNKIPDPNNIHLCKKDPNAKEISFKYYRALCTSSSFDGSTQVGLHGILIIDKIYKDFLVYLQSAYEK